VDFIERPNGFTTIHVEPAVAPIRLVLDHNIIDFAFGFEHFEDFMVEQIL